MLKRQLKFVAEAIYQEKLGYSNFRVAHVLASKGGRAGSVMHHSYGRVVGDGKPAPIREFFLKV
jgi:hypothetical protein